jgi:PPP family 3-phenylpropionic acid transporter
LSRGRELLPFAALSASYFAHIGFFNPYLPLWLKDAGVGLFAISLLTSMQSATRLFAPYAWGWLSDHTGERVRLLRFCATVALACSAGLWLGPGLWGLAGVLLLMFTHTSAMMPMSEAAMAQRVSRSGGFDARLYGRVRLCGSAGFLLTVVAAGAWFEARGMGGFPAWSAGTLALVVASSWWLPDEREPAHAGQRPEPVWSVLRRPEVAWFFVSVFLHVLAHVALYLYFSLYLDALGYGKSVIGLLWAVSVLIEIGWFFTQARWLPRLSHGGWLLLASGLAALRFALTVACGDWLWLLFAVQLLNAITFAAHHSVCIALLGEHFPARLRGRGQALYSALGYGLSGVTGGLLGAWIGPRWGLQAVFWLAAATALLACGAAWRMLAAQRRIRPAAS